MVVTIHNRTRSLHRSNSDISKAFRRRNVKTLIVRHDDTGTKYVYKRANVRPTITQMLNRDLQIEARKVQVWDCELTDNGQSKTFSVAIPVDNHVYNESQLEEPYNTFREKHLINKQQREDKKKISEERVNLIR